MLPTPSTSHVNYNQVYEPAEDSYLVLDTLSSRSEIDFLTHRFATPTPSPLVVEVGTGSGVVLAFVTVHAGTIFGRSDVATMGVDVNPFACVATRQTVRHAIASHHTQPGHFLDSVSGDLVAAVKPGCIDVLVFNPPYVPSETLPLSPEGEQTSPVQDSFSRDSHLLALATDGGIDGMETTNRLLSQLDTVLSERAVAYILLCAQNKPDEIIARIQSWPASGPEGHTAKWSVAKVSSSGKKAGWERLCIIRVWRDTISP